MAEQPVRVLVCHHHSPEEDLFTARLVQDLQEAGADVWTDTTGGASGSFVAKMRDESAGRQWMVVVMTSAALHSPSLRSAVEAGVADAVSGRMLGVLLFVMQPCAEQEIPPWWRQLRRYDATAHYEASRDGLLQAMGLSAPGVLSPASVPPPMPPVGTPLEPTSARGPSTSSRKQHDGADATVPGCIRSVAFIAGVVVAGAMAVDIESSWSGDKRAVGLAVILIGALGLAVILGRALRGAFIAGVVVAGIVLGYVLIMSVIYAIFAILMAVIILGGGPLRGALIGCLLGALIGGGLTYAFGGGTGGAFVAGALIGSLLGTAEGAFVGAISYSGGGDPRAKPRQRKLPRRVSTQV